MVNASRHPHFILHRILKGLSLLLLLEIFVFLPDRAYAQLTLPPGYRAIEWRTDGLNRTSAIAFDEQGRLLAGQVDGCILIFEDSDHDGVADIGPPIAYRQGLRAVGGLACRSGKVYVTDFDRIIALKDTNGDGVSDAETVLLDGLPTGLHAANGLVFGPDNKLYVALGSTCDVCDEVDPRSATILRMNEDGTALEIFATGLRNVYDLDFNQDGELFCGDNAFNFASKDIPPDELNHVRQSLNYGWPNYHGNPPPGSGTEAPIYLFDPHSSPDGVAFYNGLQFPNLEGRCFCTLWGEWGAIPGGQEMMLFDLTSDGAGSYQAVGTTFADGFIHPLDLIVGPEGDLFVSDYGQQQFSRIYRIEFEDLAIVGDARVGEDVNFTLRGQAGDAYLLFGSLGIGDFSFGERGRLRLDPLSLYRITTGVLPGSGELSFVAPIPDDPAFIGLTFHHQLVRLFRGTFYLGVRADLTIQN